MKKEHIPFLGTLFGGSKIGQVKVQHQSTPVVITAYSQPHVLHERMRDEKMTHGQTVMANLSPVRLENSYGKMIMYFCPMKNIQILETISNGDGGSLPAQAKIEGLSVPPDFKPGFYNLKNVTLTSNGTMQLKATNETTWEYSREV
jgi:hypothetical protein